MKRTPKPFTVEVKRSRRKEQPFALAVPIDTDPGAVTPAAADVLPAEHLPRGRILPALEQPRPASVLRRGRSLTTDKPELSRKVERKAQEVATSSIGDAEPTPLAKFVSTAPMLIPGRPTRSREANAKLPRDAFRPGERWKHRLPAAVHRSMRRQGRCSATAGH